MIMIDDANAMT